MSLPHRLPGNDNIPTLVPAQPHLASISLEHKVPNNQITLHDLIDFLIKNKEFDLYYYLLNEVCIINFSTELIEIAPLVNNKNNNIRLNNIVLSLTSNKTSIKVSEKTNGTNLKNTLIQAIQHSTAWTTLNSLFPGCEILDIVHKNG